MFEIPQEAVDIANNYDLEMREINAIQSSADKGEFVAIISDEEEHVTFINDDFAEALKVACIFAKGELMKDTAEKLDKINEGLEKENRYIKEESDRLKRKSFIRRTEILKDYINSYHPLGSEREDEPRLREE